MSHRTKDGLMPSTSNGLIAQLLSRCEQEGWAPSEFDGFRAQLEKLSDEDAQQLESLSEEDLESLRDLSEEQRGELTELVNRNAVDSQISRLRRESAGRRAALRPWKELGEELGMTPDEIREALASLGDDNDEGDNKKKKDGKAPDEARIRREAERQATDRTNAKLARAAVKLAAADLFADPADAPLYLDMSDYEIDEDGELVDPDQLTEDLEGLLKQKPHLAKTKERKTPKPLAGAGRRDATTSGLDAGRERARARFGKSDDK